MKDAPAFDFYPERWLAGVAALTDTEQAVYLRLLCHAWLNDGLPADLKVINRMAGAKVNPSVLAKFPLGDDGHRRNAKLEEVRASQRNRIATAKAKSAKMHAGRYGEKLGTDPSQAASKQTSSSSQAAPKQPSNSVQAALKQCLKAAHLPPLTPKRERENSAHQAEAIANAYPRRDSPVDVLQLITNDLGAGQDPGAMLQAVQHIARKINQAPGGASNKFVPKALTFFTNRDWRSPESFDQRWASKVEINRSQPVILTSKPNNGW
jgi:hypothetical protein